MIWFKIMISFQDEMQNLAKFTHFEKFIFIQQRLTQKMWCIGATICILNNKLQNISFKNSFIWKSEKWLKKTHNPFVKQSHWLLSTYLHPNFIWMNVIFAWMNFIYDLDYINKSWDAINPWLKKNQNYLYPFPFVFQLTSQTWMSFNNDGYWTCDSRGKYDIGTKISFIF